MLDQLRLWNAPQDVIDHTRQRLEAEAAQVGVPVWPEHWHAVQLLSAMSTQWEWVATWPKAQRSRLIYEALPAIAPAVRRALPRQLRRPEHVVLQQLQQLECWALEAWREKL